MTISLFGLIVIPFGQIAGPFAFTPWEITFRVEREINL